MVKKRRNAWTDYPEDVRQHLSASSVPQDPLRTILLKALAASSSQQLSIRELVMKLSSVSDEALAKTLEDAHEDGIVSVRGDTIGLTTLGHRASLALR